MGRRHLLPCALIAALLLSPGYVQLASSHLAYTPLAQRIQFEIEYSSEFVTILEIPGDELAIWLPPLVYAVNEIAPLTYAPIRRIGAIGLTVCGTAECVMFLDDNLSPNSQTATLLHELAHLKSWNRGKTVPESEILAETTAYLALELLGFNSRVQSISYLRQFDEKTRTRVLTNNEKDIRRWAAELAALARGGK